MRKRGGIFHSIWIGIIGILILIIAGCGSGDGTGDSGSTGNIAPVANAGLDQTTSTGQLVMLSGAGSVDANADPLTYSWHFQSLPAGSSATLTDPTTVSPTFIPDTKGVYVLTLVVNDGQVNSPPDTVVINAKFPGFVDAVLQAYAKASNTTAGAFGFHVALSGDTLAVGAAGEASCATGVNGDQTNTGCFNAGAVYVFTRTAGVWSQQAYLKASNTEGDDRFGISVALSGDTLAVGAPGEASCATGVNGDQTNNGCFGAGAVYVFTRTAGIWSQQAYLKASNAEGADDLGGDGFSGVALSGDTLAISASLEASCATGVNGDQTNNGCAGAGAVYVFTRTAGVWSQQAYLKASNTQADDFFGISALSGDTLTVGAAGEASCATGVNGDQTNNGCAGAGAVYVFTRTAGIWSQQAYLKASNTESEDLFGLSVALSGDTLAVGASGEDSCATGVNGNQTNNSCQSAGATYVFTRTGGMWSQQAYMKASNTGSSDEFSTEVALSGDTLAVGTTREDSCATGVNGNQANNSCPDSGAVYVFTRTNGSWSQQSYVKASNTDAQDWFGSSLAISADTLAVSALRESSCATGIGGDQTNDGCAFAGAAYVYVPQ